jgi:ribosomal-protein-alanine N-acetyltransferase
VIIKDAKKSDANFLASAIDLGFTDGWNLSVLNSSFDSGRFFGKICLDKDTPIGFITYSLTNYDADIESVFVLPEKRRLGVAKLLYDSAEESIKKENIEKIFLEVKNTNLSAQALYKKCGFLELSIRKKYYPDGSDAIVMVKEIKK